jgi:hypothetical protein
MNKAMNDAVVFAKVDHLLGRWRRELLEPGVDKPELVEEGIDILYRKVGKKRPLILWCDSPLQTNLIPTLIGNILPSPGWKALLAAIGPIENADSELFRARWKTQWSRLEKNTVLPLLYRIWDFQYKGETATTQQRVVERLAEHLLMILKDGRLNAETVHRKKIQRNNDTLLPGPLGFDLWKALAKLGLEVEQKTTLAFTFNTTSAQALAFGVLDHRVLTDHIPIAKEFFKPTEQQKAVLNRVQDIKAKCSELETMSNIRAAWLTQAAQGYSRPFVMPEIDHEKEVHEILWGTFQTAQKELELRMKDPRANNQIIWGTSPSWLPLALCCRMLDSDLLAKFEEEIDGWAYLFHGAAGYVLTDLACFVCRKPETLVLNDSGRPHAPFGPAATWSDGFDLHSWRGIVVEEELIKQSHAVTLDQILTEENAERRRILLDMFGEERFVRESGAQVVHRDKYGTLLQHSFNMDEPLTMVRVRNSTPEPDGSFKDYYLRVPPTMTTAKEAVAWTFGLTEDEYDPGQES